jgi:Tfp pilus assembly protein PilF
MASLLETRDRNVVPRWRDFTTTVRLGELTTASEARVAHPVPDLSTQELTWSENPGLAVAGDLISAAVVKGATEIARQASEFVLEQGPQAPLSLRSAALHVLGRPPGADLGASIEPPLTNVASTRMRSQAIARTRQELTTRPSNAVLWVDLAYLYAVRGLAEKAEKAIRAALHLAPENRFVLRSAARFFLHQNRPVEAHRLIRRASTTTRDPWLVAAEIALSLAAKSSPFFAKEGLSLVASGNFSPGQLSELNSALGTLEFSAGNSRKARRHLNSSLERPNDNSLAQATWLAQRVNGLSLEIPLGEYDIERAFEANAYRAYMNADWNNSLRSALEWMHDQPFSGRAAKSAAYIATTIQQDFELSEKISKFGQIANPREPAFLIALAYCSAQTGQLQAAADYLRKANTVDQEEWLEVAVHANYGLIAYRDGLPEAGYALYAEAAEKADKLSEKRVRINAMSHWAIEEGRFSREKALAILSQAEESAKKATGPEIGLMIDRAKGALGLSQSANALELKFPEQR